MELKRGGGYHLLPFFAVLIVPYGIKMISRSISILKDLLS